MATSPISLLVTAVHNTVETLKKTVARKYGRKVVAQPVDRRQTPEAKAREFFGRKALSQFRVKHAPNQPHLLPPTHSRFAFFAKDLDELTVEEFDHEMHGCKDKASRHIHAQLTRCHELKKAKDFPALQQQMLQLKQLSEEYLQHGANLHAEGKIWLAKKGAIDNLIQLLDQQLPDKVLLRVGLSFTSGQALIDLMEDKLMGDKQEHIASQLAELELDEGIHFLKDFQNVARTGRFPDSTIKARSFAEAYVGKLRTEECADLLSAFKITPSRDISMMRRQASAIVASCALGRVEGADGNTRQARLLHHEYRDGVLDMSSCRSKSHEVVTTTSMELDTPEGHRMLEKVDIRIVGQTFAFQAHPSMEQKLEDPSSYTRTGQIVWINSLLEVARDDDQLRDFVQLYDQVYHHTGAQWLRDYARITPENDQVFRDIDHPAVSAEAEKLTPELQTKIKGLPDKAARARVYKSLDWPYPAELKHPSYPFIVALEKRYPTTG
ncbi:MAG: hypothetical protein ACR2PT_08730 [Endozoicomonas sp.]